MNVEALTSALSTMPRADILKVMKACIAAEEKALKAAPKEKKEGPKKAAPQLERPRAWVAFTLKHANENGWEEFTMTEKKKDKASGEEKETETVVHAAEEHNGRWILPGSVDEKNPDGKQLIQKQAMVLSAIRWRPATKGKNAREASGTHEGLYQEFLQEFEARVPLSDEEKAEEKRVKEEAAAEAKEKATLEKAAKKAAAPKAAAKPAVAKESAKEPAAAKAHVAAKAPAAAKAAKAPVASPVPKKKETNVPAAPKKAKKDPFLTEEHNDGQAHIWEWKAGHRYARNYAGYLWDLEEDEEGEESVGDFAGKYDFETDTIDDSVEEPKA